MYLNYSVWHVFLIEFSQTVLITELITEDISVYLIILLMESLRNNTNHDDDEEDDDQQLMNDLKRN